jgi:hypothetical protein
MWEDCGGQPSARRDLSGTTFGGCVGGSFHAFVWLVGTEVARVERAKSSLMTQLSICHSPIFTLSRKMHIQGVALQLVIPAGKDLDGGRLLLVALRMPSEAT